MELIRGTPLYTLSAFLITLGLDESIKNLQSVLSCKYTINSAIISSSLGKEIFKSITFAPLIFCI
ncbi:hypothetical protein FACS189459_0430 [Bacilli bacterium]|nr:hypothetical protein FACS189459_0430 [Bacilli bacterium]